MLKSVIIALFAFVSIAGCQKKVEEEKPVEKRDEFVKQVSGKFNQSNNWIGGSIEVSDTAIAVSEYAALNETDSCYFTRRGTIEKFWQRTEEEKKDGKGNFKLEVKYDRGIASELVGNYSVCSNAIAKEFEKGAVSKEIYLTSFSKDMLVLGNAIGPLKSYLNKVFVNEAVPAIPITSQFLSSYNGAFNEKGLSPQSISGWKMELNQEGRVSIAYRPLNANECGFNMVGKLDQILLLQEKGLFSMKMDISSVNLSNLKPGEGGPSCHVLGIFKNTANTSRRLSLEVLDHDNLNKALRVSLIHTAITFERQ